MYRSWNEYNNHKEKNEMNRVVFDKNGSRRSQWYLFRHCSTILTFLKLSAQWVLFSQFMINHLSRVASLVWRNSVIEAPASCKHRTPWKLQAWLLQVILSSVSGSIILSPFESCCFLWHAISMVPPLHQAVQCDRRTNCSDACGGDFDLMKSTLSITYFGLEVSRVTN